MLQQQRAGFEASDSDDSDDNGTPGSRGGSGNGGGRGRGGAAAASGARGRGGRGSAIAWAVARSSPYAAAAAIAGLEEEADRLTRLPSSSSPAAPVPVPAAAATATEMPATAAAAAAAGSLVDEEAPKAGHSPFEALLAAGGGGPQVIHVEEEEEEGEETEGEAAEEAGKAAAATPPRLPTQPLPPPSTSSLPPLHPPPSALSSASPPPTIPAQMDRAPSLDARAAVARERLEWHASLSSLLEGDFAREDWELAVSLARSRAQDLTEQLIFWQTPPEPTWPAREQRLDWLEFALSEARDIATSLRQHGALYGVVARRGAGGSKGGGNELGGAGSAAAAAAIDERDSSSVLLSNSSTFLYSSGSGATTSSTPGGSASTSSFGPPEGVQAYVDIVRGVAAELAGMASLCCDAVAEGLQGLSPGSPDSRRALRAGSRSIDIVTALATRLRGLDRLAAGRSGGSIEEGTGLPTPVAVGSAGSGGSDKLVPPAAAADASSQPSGIAGIVSDLGAVCARVALAALDAAGEAQAALLTPSALRPPQEFGGETAAEDKEQLQQQQQQQQQQQPHLSAHEISVLARTVQALWTGAGELVEAVLTAWPEQRPELTRDWLVLFLGAATAATAMQRSGGTGSSTGGGGAAGGGSEIVVTLFEDSGGDNAAARRGTYTTATSTTTATTTGGPPSLIESAPTSDVGSDDDGHLEHHPHHHHLPPSRGGTPRGAWAALVAAGGAGERQRGGDGDGGNDDSSSAMSTPGAGGSGRGVPSSSSSRNKRAAAAALADASTAATLAAAAARAAAAAVAPRDEDLQAQAWIPSCLTALLASAEHAAASALEGGNGGGGGSGRGSSGRGAGAGDASVSASAAQPPPPPPPPGIEALAERLSDAMYDLAFLSARRVARLCSAAGPAGSAAAGGSTAPDAGGLEGSSSPSRLACWALELLEEQATAALVFVRDLDVSVLGRGANALRLYSMLRSAADSLVNAILRCRRALRAKRAAMEAAAQAAVSDGGAAIVSGSSAVAAADAAACESGMPRPLALTRHTSEAGMAPSTSRPATPATTEKEDSELMPPPPPRPPLPQPVFSPFEAAQNLPIAGWDDDEEEQEEDEEKKKQEKEKTAAEAKTTTEATAAAFAKAPAAHPSACRVGSLSTTATAKVASKEGDDEEERGRVPSTQQQQMPPRKPWHERLISGAVAAAAGAATCRGGGGGGGSSSSRSRSRQRFGGWRSTSTSRERPCPRRGTDGGGSREAGGGSEPLEEEEEEPLDVPPRRQERRHRSLDEDGSTVITNDDDEDDPPLPWHGDPFWEVSWESLRPTLVRKIGQGSFGQVYEATRHFAPVAVKVMTLAAEDGPPDPAVLRRFKEEVDLQRRLSLHPSIVRFLGACYDVPKRAPPTTHNRKKSSTFASASSTGGGGVTLAILMELCRLGNLFKLLEYARRVERLPSGVRSGALPPTTPEQARAKASPGWRLYHSWTTRLSIAQQVAAALAWMHSQRVIHRDMKSSNCLIRHDWAAKVADFNLSRVFGDGSLGLVQHSGAITSPEWAAPERLSGQSYGPPSDVFSFGVLLYELCTLRVPWEQPPMTSASQQLQALSVASANNTTTFVQPNQNQNQNNPLMYDAAFRIVSSVPQGARLALPDPEIVEPCLPELPEVFKLLRECWHENPAARPTAADACARLESILAAVRARQLAARERAAHASAAAANAAAGSGNERAGFRPS